MSLVSILAACSPLRFVDWVTPKNGYRAEAGLSYRSEPALELDLYAPRASSVAVPTLVFFYGGSWQTGRREDYRFVGQALASRGFVCVIPDYRRYPEGLFPDFVEDGARAVRWVRDHVEEYGGDPARVFVMGHSAGAHIAAMLVTADQYLVAEGMSPADLTGMIGLAGPYDFLPIRDPILKTIFGPEENWARTQPVEWVDGTEPPMLLVSGKRDRTVHPGNAKRLARRVRERGGHAEVVLYPSVGHIAVLAGLASPFRWVAPVLDDVARFASEQAERAWKEPRSPELASER